MTLKKLQLQILEPTGEVAVTHHFHYNAGEGNTLRLTITDNTYIMDKDGKIKINDEKTILNDFNSNRLLQ